VRRLIGDEVDVVTALAPDLPAIRADVGQLEQVILNLAVNARDAMPGGGRLSFETEHVELDEAYADARLGVQAGPHVLLRVSDTGAGMDEETQARVFEPFFTTKPPGGGTGLGLATVFGVVEQSGAHITVDSTPGRGTSFTIYFPAESAQPSPSPVKPAIDLSLVDGTETVLLVEDDDQVRAALNRFLESHGYQVLAAADGHEALELCEKHDGPLDIVVTDVRMPGLRGPDLVRRLSSLRPDTPILYISGHTDSEPILREGPGPAEVLLQKPFSAEVLAQKIREMLDAPAS